MKRPEDSKLSRTEGEALIERVKANTLSEEDRRVVVKLIELWVWLSFALTEAKLSIKRLTRLGFGGGRGAGDDEPPAPPPAGASGLKATPPAPERVAKPQSSPTRVPERPGTGADKASPKKPPPPGPGRYGVHDYTGAQTLVCRHETLRAGERCPACGQGTLYRLPPGVALRIDGHVLFSALRYEQEKLRCSACGELFTASLPAQAGEQKYTDQARAVVVLSRCPFTVWRPFKRRWGYR